MARLPGARWWVWLAACSLALGCIGPLDNPTVVHDLRILGISMDSPEVQYRTHTDADAGLLGVCSVDLTGDIAQVQNVTLSALVGDPGGSGRSLHYVFYGCPQTFSGICPDGGGYLLAEGDGPAPELTSSWPLSEMAQAEFLQSCSADQDCPATPLITAFGTDPLGLCRFGIGFQVELEVDAPDGETVIGSKLMVFTPVPDDYPTDGGCPPGPPPMVNPVVEAFTLDGTALPLDSAPEVSASFSHTLRPIEPSNGPQPYCVPNFDGTWSSLTETWLFSGVTDVGQFDREMVGGAGSVLSDQMGPSTDLNFTWSFPDGGPGLSADLYEITRNGRGGTSWIIRHADVTQ